MAYSKQTWDTTSFVTPTKMNHIEDGIEAVENEIPANISDLSDVDIDTSTLANKQVLTYDLTTQMWENQVPEVTRLKSLDMVGKTTTFNADGSISVTASDYSESITFNANGTITNAVTINGVTTTKTITFNGSQITEVIS